MPTKLYKYLKFSVNSLRAITEAEIFYTEPRKFNDPLDCSPSIAIDIERIDLERVLYRMLRKRVGPKRAKGKIGDLRYFFSQCRDYRVADSLAERNHMRCLGNDILAELTNELGSDGVFALSASWRSVLMWSHYADEHRGLCIEYDTSDQIHPRLRPVNYRSPRAINASDLLLWKLRDDEHAKARVLQTYFYTKSSEWRYEREWRDVSESSGVKEVPFRISAILFGFRCDSSIITSIVKLVNENTGIKLWHVEPEYDSFRLRRHLVDRDELGSLGVRTPSYIWLKELTDGFDDVDDPETEAQPNTPITPAA